MRSRFYWVIALALLLVISFGSIVYADGVEITSYAFANIAGEIDGTTINVHVPYSTVTTFWNHKVDVSEGATFTAGAITKISETHSQGKITVRAKDGDEKKEYEVNIYKNDFVEPTYEVSKAKSIKRDGVKVIVKIDKKDAVIRTAKVVYYTKKNSTSYRSCDPDLEEQEIEITGLKAGTKYHYYLELETSDKTYTTSAKSFTTKEAKDTGTSSSTSTNKSSTSTSESDKNKRGTNSGGPGTPAKQDEKKKNEWVKEGDNWLYFGEDGFSKIGWFQVGDKWYYTERGTNKLIMNQWKKINDVYYYFDESGAMLVNQWIKTDEGWYYAGESGSLVAGQEALINGVYYSFSPAGICLTDTWAQVEGHWRYYKPDALGMAVNENFECEGVTYHADEFGNVS